MADGTPTQFLLTKDEADARGLKTAKQKDMRCMHCGKSLVQLGVASIGDTVHWVSCRPCGCEGAIMQAAADEEARKLQEAKRTEEKLLRAGVTPRYFEAQITETATIEYVRRFGKKDGCGLYFQGDVGRGKTHQASAIAKAFCLAGYSVTMSTTIDMLDAIYSSYSTGYTQEESHQRRRAMDRFTARDLLILDDLGKENANAWSLTTLFQVVNERYQSMLPTIFTSQYDLDSLERRLARKGETETAEAIASRIAEISKIVQLTGPDRRRSRK